MIGITRQSKSICRNTEENDTEDSVFGDSKWNYPTQVEIGGEIFDIRNKCDYRVVLDTLCALGDAELSEEDRMRVALIIFYDDISEITDLTEAAEKMIDVIHCGEPDDNQPNLRLMDWEHDFGIIAPPVNRVLGRDIRKPSYLHWYTFMGAYKEIGECQFATVVSIRKKRATGKKLEKWEMEYMREHANIIQLPKKMTTEELDLLKSDW